MLLFFVSAYSFKRLPRIVGCLVWRPGSPVPVTILRQHLSSGALSPESANVKRILRQQKHQKNEKSTIRVHVLLLSTFTYEHIFTRVDPPFETTLLGAGTPTSRRFPSSFPPTTHLQTRHSASPPLHQDTKMGTVCLFMGS